MIDTSKYYNRIEELSNFKDKIYPRYETIYLNDSQFNAQVVNGEFKCSEEIQNTVRNIAEYIDTSLIYAKKAKESVDTKYEAINLRYYIMSLEKLNDNILKALDLYEKCQLESE